MAYGTVKVDNITFDNGGSDQNVTVESIYIAQTSGITVTGTVQAPSIVGTTDISGAYITGDAGEFGSLSGETLAINSSGATARVAATDSFASGATTPSVVVINSDTTDTYIPDAYGQIINTTLSGSDSLPSTVEQGGLFINLDNYATGGNTTQEQRVYGNYARVKNYGTSDLVAGTYSFVEQYVPSGSTSTNTFASYNVLNCYGSGATPLVIANYSAAQIASSFQGTISSALIGVRGRVNRTTGSTSGTVANIYGVWGNLDNDSGAVPATGITACFYGSYDTTAGYTKPYGIYIAGSTIENYFAGNVGIGIADPTVALHTSGNIVASGYIDAGTSFRGQDNDTATAPSFTWSADTNTGFYRTAADQIGVTTGGSISARFSGNDFEVYQDLTAGRVNGVYSSGENGIISSYARNSANQTSATYTAFVQLIARYTIDDVAIFQHLYRTAAGDTAATRVMSAIKATGTAWFAGSVYAGRTATSTTGTPIYYYNATETSFNAYARLSATASTSNDGNTYIAARYSNDYSLVLYSQALGTQILGCDSAGRFSAYNSASVGRVTSNGSSTAGTTTYNSGEFGVTGYAGASTSYSQLVGRNVADTSTVFRARVANADKFYVEADGSIHAVVTTIAAISDANLKSDIVDATSQWEDLKQIRWRKFRYNQEIAEKGDNAKVHLGVIAQEVEPISPGLIETKYVRNEEGKETDVFSHYEMNYAALWMKSCVALQEAMKRIETLEARVASLEAV